MTARDAVDPPSFPNIWDLALQVAIILAWWSLATPEPRGLISHRDFIWSLGSEQSPQEE